MRNTAESSTRGLAFGALAMAVLAAPALAQKPATIDPKAQEMLRQSAAAYAALRSYSCQAVTELKVDALPGSRIIQIKLALQKPNHAAVTVTKYGETQQFLTDGKSVYLFTPGKNEYLQKALTPDAPAAAAVLAQGESFVGLALMKPDGLVTNDGNLQSLTAGAPETLDGVPVQTVVKVIKAGSGGTMTLLVTLGTKDHLVHRFASVIQSPTPLPMGGDTVKVKRIDNTETYTDIQADPALPPGMFLPPAGAKKITETKTK